MFLEAGGKACQRASPRSSCEAVPLLVCLLPTAPARAESARPCQCSILCRLVGPAFGPWRSDVHAAHRTPGPFPSKEKIGRTANFPGGVSSGRESTQGSLPCRSDAGAVQSRVRERRFSDRTSSGIATCRICKAAKDIAGAGPISRMMNPSLQTESISARTWSSAISRPDGRRIAQL